MTSKTLPKPSSTNKQIQEYMAAVRKGLDSLFVVEMHEGWSVQPAIDPSKAVIFVSKEEALQNAKSAALARRGEVFVFNQAGALIGQESAR